jgi:hypothetical protein
MREQNNQGKKASVSRSNEASAEFQGRMCKLGSCFKKKIIHIDI